MGFLLAVAIFWFLFIRWGKLMRYTCTSALYTNADHWQGGGRKRMHRGRPRAAMHQAGEREVGPEGSLEVLKRRYVKGELSDEQYEEELDALFRKTSVRGRA